MKHLDKTIFKKVCKKQHGAAWIGSGQGNNKIQDHLQVLHFVQSHLQTILILSGMMESFYV